MSIIYQEQESMGFLLLCASSDAALQCVAKAGGSNGGCPCPGTLGNPDPRHRVPCTPHLGCSPTAAGAPGWPGQELGCPTDAGKGRWSPLPIDSITLQLKTGEKWTECSSGAWQGCGDTGHSQQCAVPRHGATGQQTPWWLWGGFLQQ